MQKRVKSFDTDVIFWDVYPETKHLIELESVYKDDKSKNKEESSRLMWAFMLICHPESSWFNINDKEERVIKDFLKLKSAPERFDELKIIFTELCMTHEERSLYDWGERLKKRRLYLDQQDYDIDNAEELDKAHSRTAKMHQEYEQIKKKYEEQKASVVHDGTKSSLSDSNEM